MTDRDRLEKLYEKAIEEYETECERLRKKCAELEFEIKALVDEREYYIRELEAKEKLTAGLEGQIKAFKFCIARGNIKDDR